jgi:hypothetical protein
MVGLLPVQRIVIERRYCGPPDSGNGGYTCGMVAAALEGPATVTLRKPPPLDIPMALEASEGEVKLLHGDVLVAEAEAGKISVEVPEPVGYEEAAAAARSYLGLQTHPFPTCFVCGPQRGEGDGLRVFPTEVAGRGLVAAPWIPDTALGNGDGVPAEFVWAALDCPGGWSRVALDAEQGISVLGRLTAEILGPVPAGAPLVVVGWPLETEARKSYAGTALFDADGSLLARAHSTWIRVG